jgi:uncharacterized membrane protein required for colicin V production
MEAVLIGVVLVFAYFGIEGLRHGVVRRAVEVVGLLLVFLCAAELSRALQPTLAHKLDVSDRAAFVTAWAVVLIAGVVAVRLLAAGASKLVRLSIVSWLDRTGGLILGLAFGAVISSCLLIALLAVPVDRHLKDEVRDERFTGALLNVAPAVYDLLRSAHDGERFLDMLRDKVEPVTDRAVQGLKALVEDADRDDDGNRP